MSKAERKRSNRFIPYWSRRRPLATTLLFLILSYAWATKYAGDFEELGTSARIIGLGGAAVTLARGPEAIYYNPALTARTPGNQVLLLHSEDFSGLLQHNYLGVTFSADLQSFGIGVLHNGIPGIKLTTLPDTTQPPGENNRPIVKEIVSANQLVGYFNYSRQLSPIFTLGVNTKLIYQSLGPGSCFGMGADAGLLLTPAPGLNLGFRIRNATSSPLFWSTGKREAIIPAPCAGIAKTFYLGRDMLHLAAEVQTDLDGRKLDHNLGIEYAFRTSLYGRMGLHRGNFCLGLGARYKRLYLDYGYSAGYASGSRELGSTQQVSGGVEF